MQAVRNNGTNNRSGGRVVLLLIIGAGLLAIGLWLGLGGGLQVGDQSQATEQLEPTPTPDPCNQTRADYDAARTFNYRGIYFPANPNLRPFDKQITVHHRVPLEVILLHPCLFTAAELGLSSNLTGIPNVLNGSLHLSMIGNRWNTFWATHPNPTRAEVEAEALAIDQLFGLPDLAYRHFGVKP